MISNDLDWLLNSTEYEINKGSIPLLDNENEHTLLGGSSFVRVTRKTDLPYYVEKSKYSIFSDKVDLLPGSIIVVDLAFLFEHTGIYVGNDKVVELHGDGSINLISINNFIKGGYKILGKSLSLRTGVNIYTASFMGKPIASQNVIDRAMELVNLNIDIQYHIFKNNCHMFSGYCFTGKNFQKNTDCSLFTGLTKKIIDSTIPISTQSTWLGSLFNNKYPGSNYSKHDLTGFSWSLAK